MGLTAAFAAALGDAAISCNVVAGLNHDHIFVPVAQGALAVQVLQALQQRHCNVPGAEGQGQRWHFALPSPGARATKARFTVSNEP